jgi:hypothetical protein
LHSGKGRSRPSWFISNLAGPARKNGDPAFIKTIVGFLRNLTTAKQLFESLGGIRKMAERKRIWYWHWLLARIILVIVAYVLVLFICPLIWGSVTLECVVIVITSVCVANEIIPATSATGPG